MNSRVKTLWGTKPHVYLGNVAPGVAEVGSLFPARARFKYFGKLFDDITVTSPANAA